ncbi:hypothetical protein ACG2LH_00825 [Zhouia sp. PK063]|uniref:hypothetical protein n=1 Tax=Zhouia sp. PK063 TaxID=3373602 RepID=UPI0037B1082B
MNKLKLVVAALVIAAGTFSVFAFNTTKTPVKEDVVDHYYRVNSESGSNYVIDEIEMPSDECPGGADACEFSSPTALGTTVQKSVVDDEQNGIVLLGQQDL